MRTLAGSVKRLLVVAAAFGATGCEGPDKSSLYRPLEPGLIRTEVPGIGAAPETPSDTGNGLGTGGSGNTGEEGAPSISPPLLPAEQPAAADADAGLTPVQPSAPSVDAAAPSEAPDAGPEPARPLEPECGGALLDGICWYLGGDGEACNDVCGARGGFEPAAAAWVGTPAQGGSIESCTAVLQALGELPGIVSEGFREDELGFGCHVFLDSAGAASAWWLTAPEFSPAVSAPSARLACGCLR